MSVGFGFSLPALVQYGGGGNNPFGQLGPTLDLSFVDGATGVNDLNNPTGYTLNTNFITPEYQVAAQYAIWETGVGLSQKTFSQIVTFTRASTGTYFNSAGTLTTAAINEARFDYNPSTLAAQGLLIEESRTNSIRNNTAQGAVAGTPGTVPTNWDIAISGSGITREIVGTGTESGITYIDVRFSGTGSGGAIPQIRPETTTQVVAAVGQSWSASWYLRIVGGSTTGIAAGSWQSIWQERDAAGVSLTTATVAFSAPTTANLREQRLSLSRTLTDANVARLTNRIQFAFTDGVAVDITLRIGLPQLELGAFATSVIPTTTTALTRSADVASVNTLSPWFNAVEGTLFVEASPQASNVGGFNLAELSTDVSNRIGLYKLTSTGNASLAVLVGGATQASTNSGAWTATGKLAGTYATNDFASSLNGSAAATDTSGTVPSVTTLTLGRRADGANVLNGYLRRITYYPRRLANADLQAITA